MDNFIGKTATTYYYNRDIWCATEETLFLDGTFPITENQTILYIKKGVGNVSLIDLSDIGIGTTVNYFYCQPKGIYKTWETVERELELKKFEEQFDSNITNSS
jgi:hypothetical protein